MGYVFAPPESELIFYISLITNDLRNSNSLQTMKIIAVPNGIHVAFAGNKEESSKAPLTHSHTINYTQNKSNQYVPGITDIGQGMT